jgi:hypothetical protein
MRKVLIVIIAVVILGSVGWYIYAKSRQTAPGVPSITDFSAFFPTGEQNDPTAFDGILNPTLSTDETSVDVGDSALAPSRFKQLSPHPVAGFSPYTISTQVTVPATDPKAKPTVQTIIKHYLRYVARSSGYVYEIEEGGVPLQISNVYIPNIYEALFGDGRSTALLRFLRSDQRTIATYSVPIPPLNPTGTRTQKEGAYFPDNIIQSVVSPDGTTVARLTRDSSGALLSLTSLTNTKKVDLLRTSFSEWILQWPTTKTLYLQTKASAQVPGYLYKMDTTEKRLRRVLGDINGLTTLVSPSGTYILYSQQGNNSFVTRLLNTKTNTTTTLSVAVLPEKCTWLANEELLCAGGTTVPEAAYPDAWYMGTVSFTDVLYRIYPSTMLYDTVASDGFYDMTQLAADETTRTLYFIDKKTGLLWQTSY